MGCSSSKSLGRKRRGTEYSVPQKAITKGSSTTTNSSNLMNKSWYAPVSRTVSEPINYHHIEEEDEEDEEESEGNRVKDRYHVVPLASRSSYGFLKLSDKKDDLGHIYNKLKSFRTELNPVIEEEQEEEEEGVGHPDQHSIHADHGVDQLETINAWELMEGLDDDDDDIDDGHGHGLGLGQEGGKPLNIERSLCFNRIHDLESCFDQEANSPLWKPYNDFTRQKPKMQHPHHQQHRRFKSCEGLDVVLGGEEEEEEEEEKKEQYDCYSYMKKSTTTTSPMRTPPRRHSKNKDTLKSPSGKSPTTMWPFRKSPRSPLIKSPRLPIGGSSTPLFDPTLLAKFERALQTINPSCDDWCLVNELCRANQSISTDHSSSSSHNRTLVSYASTSTSTSSSSSESPQYDVKNTQTLLASLEVMKKENAHIMSPCPKGLLLPCEDIDMSDVSCALEDFELRCPPRGEDKVVLYFTSLRGVRKTFQDCCHMRLILQGLKVDVDERDVWMHSKFREELTELLGNKRFQVPRLFVRGRYIGGIEDVSQLHEDGILVGLFEGLPSFGIYREACQGCDGVRFVPCLTCNGSCKILKDFDRIARCDKCNENGLIMCPLCCNT